MDTHIILSVLIRAALIVITVRVSCITQSSWQEDVSEVDVIFSDDLLFTTEIDSQISCAELCKTNGVKCRVFSYTSNTKECRGYQGSLSGRAEQISTSLWKRACRRDDYTYDPGFYTCVRLYNISKSWTEASDACNNDGTYLFIPDTTEKLQTIKYGMHKDTFTTETRWWAGGYDYDGSSVNDFRWGNGLPIKDTSDLWRSGEPNNDAERCVAAYSDSALLNDLSCAYEQYFACQED